MIHRIPFTIKDLKKCAKIHKCAPQKKNLFTHYYVPYHWRLDLMASHFPAAYKYACWKNIYQEPYLLVRRNDSIAHFHESFINYGFNKISYVESIRRHGGRCGAC